MWCVHCLSSSKETAARVLEKAQRRENAWPSEMLSQNAGVEGVNSKDEAAVWVGGSCAGPFSPC